jgi:hypothetical protein
VGEAKKSVSPKVYKSASARNLPVPVQSVPQLLSSMDSEETPFESPEERAYNRVVLELARQRAECEDQLGKLQQEAQDLAARISGSSGDGDGGNTTFVPSVGGNHSLTPVVTPGSFNVTNGHRSGIFNTTSDGGSSHPDIHSTECPVCPDVLPPEECGPCRECPPCGVTPGSSDGGGSCHPDSPSSGTSAFSGLVDSPASFAVGAAAVLLILAVVVLISLVVRYIPIILSGVFVLSLMCVVGYCSSKYPESARRLGTRVWEALRSGVTAVVDRLLRRNHSEVSVN